MAIITDGKGGGAQLQIDSKNRARTAAITEPLADHHAELGDRYNINTGTIDLTSSDTSAMIYLKNNEDSDLVITSFVYNLQSATAGSGVTTIDIIRNPITGTIVSVGSSVAMNQNMNFGSNKTLSINAFRGAQARTLTGGNQAISTILVGSARAVVSLGAVVLTKGSTIGVNVTPPDGTTAMKAQIAASVYLATDPITT